MDTAVLPSDHVATRLQISASSQRIMIWWSIAFMLIFGIVMGFMLKMIPLPHAGLTDDQVAAFYQRNGLMIRIGAIIESWVAAFPVPIAAVIAVQMARVERGVPIWSILAFGGGCLMSIFLVLPPLFWGIAAFDPSRPPAVTALMHQTANLTLVTTDQYFLFQTLAMAFISLTQKLDPTPAIPRWLAYYTLWASVMYELGAIAFVTRHGPFAWNGLFVFWFPFCIFGVWITLTAYALLRAISRQEAAGEGIP
ncbi:MAG TPA: hypothetical protein VMB71_06765 [Acetobacteraceae bacterium]|nr:hypothetical protein [Acetobacteraceae bacterium]